jgi:hypothetical protein
VDWQQRGIATAANMFMRNLGNTIGAALLGGILNNRMVYYFSKNNKSLTIEDANKLLKAEERSQLTKSVKGVLQEGLTFSLHNVYYVVLTFAVISMLLILFIPKKKVE